MRMPVWLRVSLFVSLVLIGVLVTTVALNVAGVDDGGPGGRMRGSGGQMSNSEHGGVGGAHGSGDRMSPSAHGGAGGDHGSGDRTGAGAHDGAGGAHGS